MNDRVFIDTNVLIYLYSDEEAKKTQALKTVSGNETFISYQVINEFINVVKKKFNKASKEISKALKEILSCCSIVDFSMSVIENALYLNEKYKYSFYDCLILSAALESDCTVLYTEDLQHNQLIEDRLRIIDPFIQS